MTTLREIASNLRRGLLRVRPLDQEPFATHLPVLAALAQAVEVRRVLELGSGAYSTPLFLDRGVFPLLEVLHSYEDDREWSTTVLDRVGSDPRLELRLVDAVPDAVPQDLSHYDLIFIDDSQNSVARSRTIRQVAARRPNGLIAIHDFETRTYRREARRFDNRMTFSVFTPQVGVAWNGQNVDRARLRRAVRAIQTGSEIGVTDQDRWVAHLRS